jgi:tetratricopeptide (TPR) repeat protein
MNETVSDAGESTGSISMPWAVAALACACSAGWLGWLKMNPPADLATARIYVEGKAWERAVPMLERLAAANPKDAEVSRLMADCLVRLERYEDATKLLESSPGDEVQRADSLFGAGVVHLLSNRRREAERVWKSILDLDDSTPGVPELQHRARDKLCMMYAIERRRGDFLAMSEEMFERSLPKDRYVPLQYRMRSIVTVVEPNAAIKELRPAVDADPNDLHSRASIAIYLADLERYDEALAEVEPCLAKSPGALFFWEAKAMVLDRRGDSDGIAQAVEKLPEGADKSAVAARMQARAAESKGDFAAAVEHLRRAAAVDPEPGDHQRAGQLLMRLRKPEDAKKELDLAKVQAPVLGEVKDYLNRFNAVNPDHVRQFADWADESGKLMDRLGRIDEGRRWRLAALAADPAYRPSLAALERDAAKSVGRD